MAQDEGRVPVGLAFGGGERVVGDGQGAADAQVVVLQVVQPALGGSQLPGQHLRGQRPAGGQAGGDDPQRERESAGQLDQGVVRMEPRASAHRAEQRRAVLPAERAEREAAGAVQCGQWRAAGDDHGAAGAGRQQGTHLGRARRVVQHQEDAGRGEERAEQGGGRVRVFGDVAGLGTEVAQECGEGLGGGERGHAGGGAVQVDVQLAVGKTLPQRMGDVEGEGALADAGHAADHGEAAFLGGEGLLQLVEFGGSAREDGRGGGKLGRGGRPLGSGCRTDGCGCAVGG